LGFRTDDKEAITTALRYAASEIVGLQRLDPNYQRISKDSAQPKSRTRSAGSVAKEAICADGFQGARICMAEPPETKNAAYDLTLLHCHEPQTCFVEILFIVIVRCAARLRF
jgi:hypothetical protein